MPDDAPIFRRRDDRRWRRLVVGALLSLGAHAALGFVIFALSLLGFLSSSPEDLLASKTDVSLINLPGDQWEQNRSVGASHGALAQTNPQPPPAKRHPEPMPKGQVVDVAPGNDQKPDDDARFLAEHNNRVKKESRAKEQTPFYKNAMPHRTTTLPPSETTGHDDVERPQTAGNQGKGRDDSEKKAGEQKGHFEIPSVEKRDKVAIAEQGKNGQIKNQSPSDKVKGNSDRLLITPGTPGAGGAQAGSLGRPGDRDVANLMPSQATLDRVAGAAPSDHLDGIDPGDGTYLNTREFKYSTFFNRVKQSVGEHWDPSAPLRQRDPDGRIYAYKDRFTMLSVTLDPQGRVKAVTVEKSCGVDFLDHEAVAAFERSQPFPNPPAGLLDQNSEIRFTFGFFLEVDSGSALRLFRSRD